MKPVHAVLTALLLVACTSEAQPDAGENPPVSQTLDLVLARTVQGSTSLRVYFDQPDTTGCDPSDFLQPGESRQEDDVYDPCSSATCVAELRLVRGGQIVEVVYVDPEFPGGIFYGHAGETELELEILGCGAPRRLPLWNNALPLDSTASLVAGDEIRISTDMPGERVSLMSVSSSFPFERSQHTQAGASSVGVLVDRCSSYVSVDALERGEESDLDGLRVRRWSSVTLVSASFCVPVENEGRWHIEGAGTASAEVTLGAPGDATTVKMGVKAASLDRPDDQGQLSWRGEPLFETEEWRGFELEQGATSDTLRLVRADKTYVATTPHVTPASPFSFALAGDSAFRMGFPALHFVNQADAGDVLDLAGLSFRWPAVHLVPLP